MNSNNHFQHGTTSMVPCLSVMEFSSSNVTITRWVLASPWTFSVIFSASMPTRCLEPSSSIITTANGFWERLNRMLIY